MASKQTTQLKEAQTAEALFGNNPIPLGPAKSDAMLLEVTQEKTASQILCGKANEHQVSGRILTDREKTPLPFNSATTNMSTPESETHALNSSVQGLRSGPKAFQFATPDDKAEKLTTCELFAAPSARVGKSNVAATAAFCDTQKNISQLTTAPIIAQNSDDNSKYSAPSLVPKATELNKKSQSPANPNLRADATEIEVSEALLAVKNSSFQDKLSTNNECLENKKAEASQNDRKPTLPSVQPFSLCERVGVPQGGESANDSKEESKPEVGLKQKHDQMPTSLKDSFSQSEMTKEIIKSGLLVGGTPGLFKQQLTMGGNDVRQSDLQNDLVMEFEAQARNQPGQGMSDVFFHIGQKCLEMSEQLKRSQLEQGRASRDLAYPVVQEAKNNEMFLCTQNQQKLSHISKTASFAGSSSIQRDHSDLISGGSLRPCHQASTSTQGELISQLCGQKRSFSGAYLKLSEKDRDKLPIQSEQLRNSKIANSRKYQIELQQQSSESLEELNLKDLNSVGQKPQTLAVWPGSLGDIQANRSNLVEPSISSKTLRGTLGNIGIGAWRHQQKSEACSDEFERIGTTFETAKALEKLSSSYIQPVARLSVIDRQKLIEQCVKEEAQIQNEFSLLERVDFVDFIRSNPISMIKVSSLPLPKENKNLIEPNQIKFEVGTKNLNDQQAETPRSAQFPRFNISEQQRAAGQDQILIANRDGVQGERSTLLNDRNQEWNTVTPINPLHQHPNTLFTQPSSSSNKSGPSQSFVHTSKTNLTISNRSHSIIRKDMAQPHQAMQKQASNEAIGSISEISKKPQSPSVISAPSDEHHLSPQDKKGDNQAVIFTRVANTEIEEKIERHNLVAHSSQEAVSSIEQGSHGEDAEAKGIQCDQIKQQTPSGGEESASQSSGSSFIRRANRQQLAETTEQLLEEVMSLLRSHHQPQQPTGWQKLSSAVSQQASDQHVPVFDKNVDYVARVQEQSRLLQTVHQLHEDNSADYLCMIKEVVDTQKRMEYKIAMNEESLAVKRQNKLSRKELKKLFSLHPQHGVGITQDLIPGSNSNPDVVRDAIQTIGSQISMADPASGLRSDAQHTIFKPETAIAEVQDKSSLDVLFSHQQQQILSSMRLHEKFPENFLEQALVKGTQNRLNQISVGISQQQQASDTSESNSNNHMQQLKQRPRRSSSMGNLCSVVDQEMVQEVMNQNLQSGLSHHQQSSNAGNQIGPLSHLVGPNSVAGCTRGQAGIKNRKIRRTANQINKEYKCFYCEKFYGSEAAAIMHMRKKHKEGTKQEIERRKGIRVKDILKSQVTLPMSHYSQDLAPAPQTLQQSEQRFRNYQPALQSLSRQQDQNDANSIEPIANPSEIQARLMMSQIRIDGSCVTRQKSSASE